MYDRSTPGDGETISESPAEFYIVFLEGIYLTSVRLRGSDGSEWPIDWKKTEENVFNTRFRTERPLPPGDYQIEWDAYVRQHLHDDGGTIKFTIKP